MNSNEGELEMPANSLVLPVQGTGMLSSNKAMHVNVVNWNLGKASGLDQQEVCSVSVGLSVLAGAARCSHRNNCAQSS